MKTLRFSFDYRRACLWCNGGRVDYSQLPISKELIDELNSICDEFDTQIDWNDPTVDTLWTEEHYINFFSRANAICEKLKEELKGKYEIINCLEEDRRL
ncbi:MAG: hypothetical protein J1F09_07905 [Oscillospiraceae bacterium]|nr:hypothetical protein [Oscillospiraceae bacterium]